MADLTRKANIIPLVDGMRELLATYLVAHTRLSSDVAAGDLSIPVQNSARFREGEEIVVFDDDSTWDDSIGERGGVEFHTVAADPSETGWITVQNPLGRAFEVSKNARIQKALQNAVLDSKDIYYGDREAFTFSEVGICVDPGSKTSEWLAIGGLAGYDYKMSIMVYAKVAGSGGERDEDRAARVCHAYADAIEDLLIRNIHLDLVLKEVPLVADACSGNQWVFIPKTRAGQWQPDACRRYEVQDNFGACQGFAIVDPDSIPESSSSSCVSFDISTSSDDNRTTTSASSMTMSSSLSSSASTEAVVSSSSSASSLTETESSSGSSETRSSASTSSSPGADAYQVYLDKALLGCFRVSDKAVLRRKDRWMYDSRVESTTYGEVAKGSFILKAARLEWFGKESRHLPFPQVGLGGDAY